MIPQSVKININSSLLHETGAGQAAKLGYKAAFHRVNVQNSLFSMLIRVQFKIKKQTTKKPFESNSSQATIILSGLQVKKAGVFDPAQNIQGVSGHGLQEQAF